MSTYYHYNDLSELLGLAPPALMLDRAYIEDNQLQGTGLKTVTIDEEFFIGHFPDSPILPGVLQVTAMSQTALLTVLNRENSQESADWQVAEINKVKFRNPVYPGDRLFIKAEIEKEGEGMYKVNARTIVNDQVACQGEMTIAQNKLSIPPLSAENFAPELPAFPEDKAENSCNVNGLMKLIPHRYPFLLVDKILHMDTENGEIVGLKNITGNEPFFNGQNARYLPAELHPEIAAQTGCALAMARADRDKKIAYFMSIDNARFHSAVCPGDQLVINIAVNARARFGKGEGVLKVGDRTVSELQIKFAIVDREE